MEEITELFDYEKIAALESEFTLEEDLERKYRDKERSFRRAATHQGDEATKSLGGRATAFSMSCYSNQLSRPQHHPNAGFGEQRPPSTDPISFEAATLSILHRQHARRSPDRHQQLLADARQLVAAPAIDAKRPAHRRFDQGPRLHRRAARWRQR